MANLVMLIAHKQHRNTVTKRRRAVPSTEWKKGKTLLFFFTRCFTGDAMGLCGGLAEADGWLVAETVLQYNYTALYNMFQHECCSF